MQASRRAPLFSALILTFLTMGLGCAAEMAHSGAGPIKQEALAGAVCTIDAGCDWGEFCEALECTPGPGCTGEGICRVQTHFADTQKWDIPDDDPVGVTGEIFVDRPPSALSSLWVSIPIRHTYQGDLRVVLHSPAGTQAVLADQEGGSADDLSILRYVTAFDGEDPAGLWRLHVSDLARFDVGTLGGWEMDMLFAPPGSDPNPATDVWATVPARVDSLHPYRNGTSLWMNLERFTGTARRTRIHFSRLDTEPRYDFVDVIDRDTGEVLEHFTGHLGEFTTQEYPTGNLEVHLSSDHSITDWGFSIDRLDVFGAGCLSDADCGEGYDCPVTHVCVQAPCFQRCMPEEPTPPGSEGDPCATLSDCEEGLYCDSTSICATGGSCNITADCSAPGNAWVHILCVGYPSCDTEAGLCTWVCSPGPPVCEEGYTRFEDCNTCTCIDGRWSCTEMACVPEAGLGEACAERVACERGLVCDRGRAEGAVCGRWDGICLEPGTQERCSVIGGAEGPVCTCTGQTFENECARQGYSADWASDGRCALSELIPDADVDGITAHVGVMGPTNSRAVRVQVEIDHTYRGDLEVWVMAPNGVRHTLTDRQGRSADDFYYDGTFPVSNVLGGWTLHAVDHASLDVGVLRFFNVIPEDPAPTLGADCFVANGVICDYGEFCHYRPPLRSCGFGVGVGGVCELQPTVCSPGDSPVCGCSGTEYANECMAHADGSSVRYDSPCPW